MTALEPAPASAGAAAPVLVLHASPWRVALVAAGGVALVAAGVLMARVGEDLPTRAFGVFAAAFFALCTVAAAAQALRPSRLELDAEGFTLTVAWRRPKRWIWADVAGVFVWRMRMNRFVAWTFRPERRPAGAIYKVNAALGAEAMLPPGWPIKPEALAALMERMRVEAARVAGEAG